jgi:hypothetical protein
VNTPSDEVQRQAEPATRLPVQCATTDRHGRRGWRVCRSRRCWLYDRWWGWHLLGRGGPRRRSWESISRRLARFPSASGNHASTSDGRRCDQSMANSRRAGARAQHRSRASHRAAEQPRARSEQHRPLDIVSSRMEEERRHQERAGWPLESRQQDCSRATRHHDAESRETYATHPKRTQSACVWPATCSENNGRTNSRIERHLLGLRAPAAPQCDVTSAREIRRMPHSIRRRIGCR